MNKVSETVDQWAKKMGKLTLLCELYGAKLHVGKAFSAGLELVERKHGKGAVQRF